MDVKTGQSASEQPALSVNGVSKAYRSQQVLTDITCELPPGETLALVGVNGAGKTTLLKGILDLTDLDDGGVSLFGVSNKRTESRASLAYLPERFLPPAFATGQQFLDFHARMHGRGVVPKNERAAVLADLDLSEVALQRTVAQLSKGMAQKLGLAAMLESGKPLLILDEPMSGLDPKARALFKRALKRRREAGGTLLFSTHLLADVEDLCDRLAVLHAGTLRFIGSVGELLAMHGADDLEEAYLRSVEAPD